MGTKALAEAIMLQSIEDLWHPAHRNDSIEFFSGDGFRLCAGMAELSAEECAKILEMCGMHCAKEPALKGT